MEAEEEPQYLHLRMRAAVEGEVEVVLRRDGQDHRQVSAEEVSRALGSIQEQLEEEVEDEMEVDGMLYVKVEEGQQDCSTEEQREQSS